MRKQLKTIIYEILEVSYSTNLYSFADALIIPFLNQAHRQFEI